MKRIVIYIIVFSYLIVALPRISYAARTFREDTVTESMWDWLTTLGKSPEEKKRIKHRHRIERARKEAEKKKRIKEKELDKANEERAKEAQEMRSLRLEKRRKEIGE